MAQTEDTELRDLVIEALEKNGSLAKIRALLRANIFLAFEDDCEKIKHNTSLDSILKVPEGVLSLSIVHEFLEYCNLKNTLFVYMSETRQGKDYSYEGQKQLAEKLSVFKRGQAKEPILLSILRSISKVYQRKFYEHGDNGVQNKDDQNCTYIVHEDSSTASSQSNSHSDQSSDEKNKLHLRLPLDNSDTDTSSDSARDKTSSEYIPNEHIVIQDESEDDNKSNVSQHSSNNSDAQKDDKSRINTQNNNSAQQKMHEQHKAAISLPTINSSESTSYMDLKPFNRYAEKLLNTTGLPVQETDVKQQLENQEAAAPADNESKNSKDESASSATLSNVTSISSKQAHGVVKTPESITKLDTNTPEYSYDFSASPPSRNRSKGKRHVLADSVQDTNMNNTSKNLTIDSPHQNSQSSQSSVSISDVADLIEVSEANSPYLHRIQEKDESNISQDSSKQTQSDRLKNENKSKVPSDDSGDFSESPIPSLSNLSLDFHSD